MPPLSEKVKVLYLMRKRNYMVRSLRFTVRMKSSVREIVKEEKVIHASLLRERERPHLQNFYYSIVIIFYFNSC